MKARNLAPYSLLLLIPTMSLAEDEQKNGAPNPKPRIERPAFLAWKKIDANQDGRLSYDEFIKLERVGQIPADKQKLIFERLDKNADGNIQPNELQFMPDQDKRQPMLPNLREIDTNQDMQVSFEEFVKSPVVSRFPEERQRKIFEKLDQNGDGFLSPKDRPDGMHKKRPFFPKKDGALEHDENRDPKPQLRDIRLLWQEIDTNQDEKLSFSEFQHAPVVKHLGEDAQEDRFELIDKDRDSFISRDEWQQQPKPNFPPRPERNLRRDGAPDGGKPEPEMMEE